MSKKGNKVQLETDPGTLSIKKKFGIQQDTTIRVDDTLYFEFKHNKKLSLLPSRKNFIDNNPADQYLLQRNYYGETQVREEFEHCFFVLEVLSEEEQRHMEVIKEFHKIFVKYLQKVQTNLNKETQSSGDLSLKQKQFDEFKRGSEQFFQYLMKVEKNEFIIKAILDFDFANTFLSLINDADQSIQKNLERRDGRDGIVFYQSLKKLLNERMERKYEKMEIENGILKLSIQYSLRLILQLVDLDSAFIDQIFPFFQTFIHMSVFFYQPCFKLLEKISQQLQRASSLNPLFNKFQNQFMKNCVQVMDDVDSRFSVSQNLPIVCCML